MEEIQTAMWPMQPSVPTTERQHPSVAKKMHELRKEGTHGQEQEGEKLAQGDDHGQGATKPAAGRERNR